MSTKDDQLAAWARASLERDLDHPDEFTAARLRAIRLRALERTRGRSRWTQRLIPAATVAAAFIVALTFSIQRTPPTASEPMVFDLLADSQDLELIEELEFYEWLERRDNAG